MKNVELFAYSIQNLHDIFFFREWIEIDKKKLLEIARRNAINMIKQGTLPLAQQDKAIAAIQSGGKTVDELTGYFSYILMHILFYHIIILLCKLQVFAINYVYVYCAFMCT